MHDKINECGYLTPKDEMYYFLEINSILIQFKFMFIVETRNEKVMKNT